MPPGRSTFRQAFQWYDHRLLRINELRSVFGSFGPLHSDGIEVAVRGVIWAGYIQKGADMNRNGSRRRVALVTAAMMGAVLFGGSSRAEVGSGLALDPAAVSLPGGIEQFLKRPDPAGGGTLWGEKSERRRVGVRIGLGWNAFPMPDNGFPFPAWEMHLRMHSNFVANAIVPHLTPPEWRDPASNRRAAAGFRSGWKSPGRSHRGE